MNRLFALALLALSACSRAGTPRPVDHQTLNVFAATSLTDAFIEIGSGFESSHPGVVVAFNFAGSQALRTQIEEGAPADVFASASARDMDALIDAGLVDASASRLFVSNELVVILPEDNPAAIASIADLAQPGLRLVLPAQSVPAGDYARRSLERMNAEYGQDFSERVLINVVSNEDNVRQVVAKVELGEADAGIVYSSDAVAATGVKTIRIPAAQNITAAYPIAPLAGSEGPELAAAFIEAVFSADGQAALQKWGFLPP